MHEFTGNNAIAFKYSDADKYEIIKPKKVIILDGILVLEDERIRDLADIKIFVESDDDIRFIRRIIFAKCQ